MKTFIFTVLALALTITGFHRAADFVSPAKSSIKVAGVDSGGANSRGGYRS